MHQERRFQQFAVLVAVVAVVILAMTEVAPAAAQGPPSGGTGASISDLPDSVNPVEHSSIDGRFSATFPTGCSRLMTKKNKAEDGSTNVEMRMIFVTCDRKNTKEEGCMVNARLGAARGLKGNAAVDEVLAAVGLLMKDFGVVPASQTPVRRDFGARGLVEGIEIKAHRDNGKGDVWIRGLLFGEDVYLLAAWKSAGGLLADPEYAVFFQSFVPWAD